MSTANPLPLDAAARAELARKVDVTRLEGLAKDAIVARREKERCVNELRFDEAAMYRGIEVGAERSLREYCTPDVILALLALVRGAEAETRDAERLHNGLDDLAIHQRDGWDFYACKDVDPIVARLTATLAELADAATAAVGEADRETTAFVRLRAAIDAARAHPPIQETDADA